MPSYRHVLRCAVPGLLLALICLAPFFNKAYTIDDAYFLFESQQSLRTPLNPTATSICWGGAAYKRPLREIGSPAVLMAYLLEPTVLAGSKEWVGHLTIFLFFAAAVMATVALAFRCGCNDAQATLAGLIFASCPVVLAMAGTVMPDIPATALATIGMERLLAWRDERKILQGVAAGIALGLAPLARLHTILLLGIGALALCGDLWPFSLSKIRKIDLIRFLPIVLAVACYFAVSVITSDPTGASSVGGVGGPNMQQVGLKFLKLNLPQFGVTWMLGTPFGIAWLLLSGRRGLVVLLGVWAGAVVHFFRPHDEWALLYAIGLAGLIVVFWVVAWAIRNRDTVSLWLGLWLLITLPMVVYFHFPFKYIVPCAPAAAILLARRLWELSGWRRTLTGSGIVAAGVALGLAILIADASFAGLARRVVAEYVEPQIRAGHNVWYAGQWSLQWYAEKAGAACLVDEPPKPRPGDIVVAGGEENGLDVIDKVFLRKRLLQTIWPKEPGGRIMGIGVGFYSNTFGYLPWRWSKYPLNVYFVWSVE